MPDKFVVNVCTMLKCIMVSRYVLQYEVHRHGVKECTAIYIMMCQDMNCDVHKWGVEVCKNSQMEYLCYVLQYA